MLQVIKSVCNVAGGDHVKYYSGKVFDHMNNINRIISIPYNSKTVPNNILTVARKQLYDVTNSRNNEVLSFNSYYVVMPINQ